MQSLSRCHVGLSELCQYAAADNSYQQTCEICFLDPDDLSSVTITDITETSVTVSWSVGQTNTVNATSVYYRATDTDSWDSVSATGTSHTVTSLQPGTEYQFFVMITSYGKSASSQNTTATTGNVAIIFALLLDQMKYPLYDISKNGDKSDKINVKVYLNVILPKSE